MRLAGKTAIVTGAGSAGSMGGTGSDIAILFALKGANVVILDVDEARALHTERGSRSDWWTPRNQRRRILRSLVCLCRRPPKLPSKTFGRIDALVNNAAIAPGEQENSEALWDRILTLNLKAAKFMSDAVLPQMKAQGSGSIVHISSIAGLVAGGGIAYSASKGGMIAMAKAQAFEYGRMGIRVNTVAPGHVAIPMGLNFKGWDGAGTDAIRGKRARASLLGTEGTGWDIRPTRCMFLANE